MYAFFPESLRLSFLWFRKFQVFDRDPPTRWCERRRPPLLSSRRHISFPVVGSVPLCAAPVIFLALFRIRVFHTARFCFAKKLSWRAFSPNKLFRAQFFSFAAEGPPFLDCSHLTAALECGRGAPPGISIAGRLPWFPPERHALDPPPR